MTEKTLGSAAMLVLPDGTPIGPLDPLPMSLAAVARSMSMTRSTGTGTVALGAVDVSITNVGSAPGVAAGADLKPGETVGATTRGGDTFEAISWDATGTEFVIVEVR